MDTDEPLNMMVVVAEFPTPAQALVGYEDLARWVRNGRNGISMYRLAKDGQLVLVVAVLLTESPYVKPLISRLKRKGGKLSDIPDEPKRQLVERTLQAMGQGVESETRGQLRPLDAPPPDPSSN